MIRYILIDFENVQKIDLDLGDPSDTKIVIFVGRSQNKIPFALVEKAQSMGDRLSWIKIAGDGKNNLDFHIAYELGRLTERTSGKAELVILSKDGGYDPLIQYVRSLGIKTRRITNTAALTESHRPLPSSRHTEAIVTNLKKISSQKRPRSRGTLRKHVESILREKADSDEIEKVIEEMFSKGLISQSNSRLKYSL